MASSVRQLSACENPGEEGVTVATSDYVLTSFASTFPNNGVPNSWSANLAVARTCDDCGVQLWNADLCQTCLAKRAWHGHLPEGYRPASRDTAYCCRRCGAQVTDPSVHDTWHSDQDDAIATMAVELARSIIERSRGALDDGYRGRVAP